MREAEYALAAVEPYKLDYPIAFDYEGDSVRYAKTKGVTPNKAHVSALARAFCGRIEQGGYYAMVYTNPAYLSQYFDADIPKEFDIWLAQWPTKPDPNSKPSQAGGIWQYTSSGSVSGISGRVDMDAGYYDYPAIIKANGLNQPAAPPEPEPVPEPDPETPAKTETELAREWVMAEGISDGTNPDNAISCAQPLSARVARHPKNLTDISDAKGRKVAERQKISIVMSDTKGWQVGRQQKNRATITKTACFCNQTSFTSGLDNKKEDF